jgi:hypothetical protein
MAHENKSEMTIQGVIGLKEVEFVEGMAEVCGRPQGLRRSGSCV